MLRDDLFRSGAPMMIATICMMAFGYVAVIRRERLAGFWTLAWALLACRYAWVAYWGSPNPNPIASLGSAMLRVTFAMTVLTGALALRGVRLRLWYSPVVGVLVPLSLSLVPELISVDLRTKLVLFTMFVLIIVAAERIATATSLPHFERRATAVSLALYGTLSAISSQMPNGSTIFTTATVFAWASQLMVAVSILATFFRLSYDAELASRAVVENRLTLALGGFVHLCMHCKSVRDAAETWQPLERFIAERTSKVASHGLCGDCARKHYPDEFATLSTR